MTSTGPGSSIRWPRSALSRPRARPRGATPTARAAASAASALGRMCGDGERQLEVVAQLGDVAAGPERDGVQVVAPVGVEQRLAGRQDRRGAGPQVGEQLGLRRRDRLERAEQLEVDRADVGDHADVGLGDRRQLGDLAGAAHRHLEHEHLGAGGRREDRQRQADLGVEVLRVGDDADVRASIAARMSFVDVLPVEPVIATTARSSARRHAAPAPAARRADRRRRGSRPPS